MKYARRMCVTPTCGVYVPEASTETLPYIEALLTTERSAGLYSCDDALRRGASFLLDRALPSTVKPCHSRGPLVYTTCGSIER